MKKAGDFLVLLLFLVSLYAFVLGTSAWSLGFILG